MKDFLIGLTKNIISNHSNTMYNYVHCSSFYECSPMYKHVQRNLNYNQEYFNALEEYNIDNQKNINLGQDL